MAAASATEAAQHVSGARCRRAVFARPAAAQPALPPSPAGWMRLCSTSAAPMGRTMEGRSRLHAPLCAPGARATASCLCAACVLPSGQGAAQLPIAKLPRGCGVMCCLQVFWRQHDACGWAAQCGPRTAHTAAGGCPSSHLVRAGSAPQRRTGVRLLTPFYCAAEVPAAPALLASGCSRPMYSTP